MESLFDSKLDHLQPVIDAEDTRTILMNLVDCAPPTKPSTCATARSTASMA
ncbi:MAG: hypothetical protein WBQ78_16435 [Gammaproteobacteria bacterium]